MRLLLQRVKYAQVAVSGEVVGQVGAGLLILVGITHDDTMEKVAYLAEKSVNLRIFEDDGGKMNLSLKDVGGGVLAVSQFTLYADARKGLRPGYSQAAEPVAAKRLYLGFIEKIRELNVPCEAGIFGADMQVTLCNDGPVTILLER